MQARHLTSAFACVLAGWLVMDIRQANAADESEFRPIRLQSRITDVQPMTGIVMWQDSRNSRSDSIQLEYSYMRYSDVVQEKGVYDWTAIERVLESVAARKHQAILRFWDTYPGKPTGVPDYLKNLPDYQEVNAPSENRDTGFPDWSHPELQRFILEFYQNFAARYDQDPRLAFLETGFGLWAEYHIYSGPEELGKTFPSKEFQATFLQHLDVVLVQTPWMISQDAHSRQRAPFASQRKLIDLHFGVFDDSFHLAWEPGYNLEGWTFFVLKRYRKSPAGGEILFPNQKQEKYVAENWATEARNFGITFIIGEQWPQWTTDERIQQHGLACGYKFKILAFDSRPHESRITITNTGVAPIYYDAFVAVNGVRADESLKFLQPGETRQLAVPSGGQAPQLTIECDRLVAGQRISFDALLEGE
ncbi:DUF4832 domain-containing protein [Aureliella helgolandensis]|uniref:DUF4832 domain-containing protein n=1 Tax=Aureliella helgolandensis TaxID=2527968 RepID=UPI0018D01419|nr:DUF4832 domain-containing protein [Aureliella helgolandensis]